MVALHSLSTASDRPSGDWAADNGYADSWAEAALAHANPNKTEAAYRRTTFFNQRRDKLMPAWASFVMGDESNVVSLAERRP